MRAIPSVVVLFALTASEKAEAAFVLASDGRAYVSEIEALALNDGAETSWAVRARLDGSASSVALLLPVPKNLAPGSLEVLSPEALAAVESATAPRWVEHLAVDPCSAGSEREAKTQTHALLVARPTLSGRFEVQALDLQRPRALEGWLLGARLSLKDERRAELVRHLGAGSKLVALRGPLGKKSRGRWTPWVTLRVGQEAQSLPFELAVQDVTPGKELLVSLYTVGSKRALLPRLRSSSDVPTQLSLPEVALEDQEDLVRAIVQGVLRRESGPHTVRLFSERLEAVPKDAFAALRRLLPSLTGHAVLGHYAFRAKQNPPLAYAASAPHRVEWNVRRVWRAPIACGVSERYAQLVRLQQNAELRAFATVTGRPFAEVMRQHQARALGPRSP